MLTPVDRYNFREEVLEAPHVVLVNFWVNWSEECKKMRRVMRELDQQLEHETIVEVNWETEKELAEQYGVIGVPTLLIFDQGDVVGRYSGTINTEEFLQEAPLDQTRSKRN